MKGQELSADVLVPSSAILEDAERVRSALLDGARALRATVLSEHTQLFEPTGITAVVIIGESHLLLSTYPELSLATVNIHSCSPAMELMPALTAICLKLEASEVSSMVLLRHLDTPCRVEQMFLQVPFENGELQLERAASAQDSAGADLPRPAVARA